MGWFSNDFASQGSTVGQAFCLADLAVQINRRLRIEDVSDVAKVLAQYAPAEMT